MPLVDILDTPADLVDPAAGTPGPAADPVGTPAGTLHPASAPPCPYPCPFVAVDIHSPLRNPVAGPEGVSAVRTSGSADRTRPALVLALALAQAEGHSRSGSLQEGDRRVEGGMGCRLPRMGLSVRLQEVRGGGIRAYRVEGAGRRER